MLKTRIIPTLLCRAGQLVKGRCFDSWRRVGSAVQAVRLHNLREVDELVFLDISATPEWREPDYALVECVASECFMPLAVGGGVRSVEHVRQLLRAGADKVVIGTAALECPGLIADVASAFGSQCVVAAIDYRSMGAVTRCGAHATGLDPAELAAAYERQGAGEILLTSIERDGTLSGYDLQVTADVCRAVSVPVIAAGGCGRPEHMAEVLRAGAHAVAAGAMFQFTETTPLEAKRYLRSQGFAVRIPQVSQCA